MPVFGKTKNVMEDPVTEAKTAGPPASPRVETEFEDFRPPLESEAPSFAAMQKAAQLYTDLNQQIVVKRQELAEVDAQLKSGKPVLQMKKPTPTEIAGALQQCRFRSEILHIDIAETETEHAEAVRLWHRERNKVRVELRELFNHAYYREAIQIVRLMRLLDSRIHRRFFPAIDSLQAFDRKRLDRLPGENVIFPVPLQDNGFFFDFGNVSSGAALFQRLVLDLLDRDPSYRKTWDQHERQSIRNAESLRAIKQFSSRQKFYAPPVPGAYRRPNK
jgi:hypothetical protein